MNYTVLFGLPPTTVVAAARRGKQVTVGAERAAERLVAGGKKCLHFLAGRTVVDDYAASRSVWRSARLELLRRQTLSPRGFHASP